MLQPVVPDGTLARRLAAHEAAAHAANGRELRDLGDALLLYDPTDAEPFWNRVVAPRWPPAADAFNRRLDEVVTLFATLGRRPHLRSLPVDDQPADLVDRLVEFGFRTVGLDRAMILEDPGPCLALARTVDGRSGLSVEHVGRDPGLGAIHVARLLVQAFGVETDRVPALGAETLNAGRRPGGAALLLLEAGVPAAAARRLTVDGGTYLSSIGTAPGLQGRGHGSLVTAIAVTEALAEGTGFVHLLVDASNLSAIDLYTRLGFIVIGDPIVDLLLR
ncbi:MAG: family N-acetyltransferase [Chloroflexi bacterium]|nr:family N-acetyltransferase [Chloroflexota bacterium]